MAYRIILRNDMKANWELSNPILALGEVGIDRTLGMMKIGDGTSAWNDLPYRGIDGTSVLNGSVDPASEGKLGDFYVNTASNTIFGPKTESGWGTGVSLVGPQGPMGPASGRTIFNGVGNPAPEVGDIDDFYLDTFSKIIFGPKTITGWGSGTSLIGPVGPAGEKGDQGVAGPQGNIGPVGPVGPRGNTVLSGDSDPVSGAGSEGDFYLNVATSTIFGPRKFGEWGTGVSLIGPSGTNGNTILNGPSNPTGLIGVDGDFYIQTTDGLIYGPKSMGVWGLATSIIGAHELSFHSDVDGWADSNPNMDGTASPGVSNRIARQDHIHPSDSSKEPVFSKNTAFNKNFGSSAGTVCEGNDVRLSDARTPTSHGHSASEVTSGVFDAARIPILDASQVGTGVFDINRIPAAALERLVPVVNQAARFSLTTNEVQLGDTVKQLDTGVMYVVIDVANLGNASGYTEYTAASAASVPWSGVTAKPTTLSGYGITDATPSTHVGSTGSAHGVATTSVNGFMSSTDKTKLDGVASGATAYSDSLARTACVAQTITNGVTTSAPSQEAVFEALALKAPVASPTFTGTATSASFASTVATGTAPMTVVSTTVVTNLNADTLDGNHASAFATSGHTHNYAGSASAGGAANSVANSHSPGTGLSGSAYNGSAAQTWNVLYGSSAGTACQGNDTRLSDARTPISHTHGNVSNAGAIGTTAGLPIVTGTSGILQAGSWSATTPAAATTTGAVGTSTSPARSDHAHPSRIATSAPASPVNGDIWIA